MWTNSVEAHHIKLTSSQENLLGVAYLYGSQIGFPETIQALLLQESSARKSIKVGDTKLPFGKRSYGVMQIKLASANMALSKLNIHFDTEEEVIASLITDPYFNIAVATTYFKTLHDRFKSWSMAVVAYNRGPGWVKRNKNKVLTNPYLLSIRSKIYKIVRPFNQTHKIYLAK